MVAIRNGSNYDYHFIIKVLTWKLNYLFKKKKRKIQNLFSSNKETSCKNW